MPGSIRQAGAPARSHFQLLWLKGRTIPSPSSSLPGQSSSFFSHLGLLRSRKKDLQLLLLRYVKQKISQSNTAALICRPGCTFSCNLSALLTLAFHCKHSLVLGLVLVKVTTFPPLHFPTVIHSITPCCLTGSHWFSS